MVCYSVQLALVCVPEDKTSVTLYNISDYMNVNRVTQNFPQNRIY